MLNLSGLSHLAWFMAYGDDVMTRKRFSNYSLFVMRVTDEYPHKRPVMRTSDFFLILVWTILVI